MIIDLSKRFKIIIYFKSCIGVGNYLSVISSTDSFQKEKVYSFLNISLWVLNTTNEIQKFQTI